MIVFRDQRAAADPTRLLSRLRLDAARVAQRAPADHDEVVQLLIGLGTLEAAVLDTIFPAADGTSPLTRKFREASCAVGRALWHTWGDQAVKARFWLEQATATLAYLELQQLPSTVEVSVPEGYAYYAVYPEMYLEAARKFHSTIEPTRAVCLGLRTIGASLSAVVAGSLQELGCRVASYTLRPRGHPFARRPIVDSGLADILHRESDGVFLVVDEGPGISGSSLAGTAALLNDLGIPDERIVMLPSWATDGSGLKSAQARERWQRHRQFVVDFEEVWLRSGRLTRSIAPGQLRDLSGGAWRHQFYPDSECFPAVQPQHERRKYLYQSFPEPGVVAESSLLSFVGLGDRSASKLERGRKLASAGFTAEPKRVVQGFLVTPFTPGTPLSAHEPVDHLLLQTLASYLAHISRTQATQPSVTDHYLQEMVTSNVVEGLGDEWLSRLHPRLANAGDIWCQRPVALDGRMLPHEWIRTAGGYLKTDAVDHHDDHFFPGCQDIAWDLAGTCLEFNLTPEARRQLIERYERLSGDAAIASRLPLHAITYLAFRLGYATLAATTLAHSPDGARFSAAATRYGDLLRSELTDTRAETWNA